MSAPPGSEMLPGVTAVRGAVLTYRADPFLNDTASAVHYEPDAIVTMAEGKIVAFGPAATLRAALPSGLTPTHYPEALILPGFIDCHVHYAQIDVIAGHGATLIEWLERRAFVAEQAFDDEAHARDVARRYFDESFRHGITSAAVFCTTHATSVEAFFTEAERRGVRVAGGKVMMNRNAPAPLCDTTQRGYDEAKALIRKWHGHDRLGYAITPRFAPTSTPDQLAACGALKQEFPDCYVQSHVAETLAENEWVRALFPDAQGYLDVYDRHGLVGQRTIYGHGIHLAEEELQRCHASGAAIAHCPTSNLFLGSGLFDLALAKRSDRPLRIGMGTDVGGGTTLSMLRTLSEAYKVAQLKGHSLAPHHAFYLATRGGAHALYLDDKVGSIAPGMEADLVVLDLNSSPFLAQRMKHAETLEEALLLQMMLAGDRAVRATYVAGEPAYARGD